MLEYCTNISNFWKDNLDNHDYARKVAYDNKPNNVHPEEIPNGYVLQSFNQELPDADKFKQALNVDKGTVSWTCIPSYIMLPTHSDSFYTLRTEHNVSVEQCFRYLIFLEDAVFGQFVGFKNQDISNFKAGDVWKFDHTEIHWASNGSNMPLHTCQVSTFIN
jgi:hypothetical protein